MATLTVSLMYQGNILQLSIKCMPESYEICRVVALGMLLFEQSIPDLILKIVILLDYDRFYLSQILSSNSRSLTSRDASIPTDFNEVEGKVNSKLGSFSFEK